VSEPVTSEQTGGGRWRSWVAGAAAFAAGLVGATFTSGLALFSDGHFADRPPVLIVSWTVFGVIGAVFSMAMPRHWKPVAIGLICASLFVVWFFGRDVVHDPKMLVLAVGFALGDAAAGSSGALLGVRLRHHVR
jgi:hypothetical protein